MSSSESDALAALRAENQNLQVRLEEAEELLRVICAGEVDSLVVTGAYGDQIFSLWHAEWNYRLLAEEMNQGAAILSADGTTVWANRHLAEILRLPLENLLGVMLDQFLPENARQTYEEWLAKVSADRREREFIGVAADGA